MRFVCVFRVPECARVSRACPVCVPAPPGVFLPDSDLKSCLENSAVVSAKVDLCYALTTLLEPHGGPKA